MSNGAATRSNPLVDVTAIRSAIRQRVPIADEVFDTIYPATQRHRSGVHWTPIDAALLVSEWLSTVPGGNVLDVGSGVGKACHVGALATDATWTGVERVPAMVRIAARISRELGVQSRTRFIRGEALGVDWSPFGGVYLFNPFSEAVYAVRPTDPVVRQAAYIHEVLAVERKLLTLQAGARVVTYHGFGGEMPAELELLESVPMHDDFMCLWSRRATATT